MNNNELINDNEIPNWRDIARPEQLFPEDDETSWLWLILAGRGFGKTRTGAETIMELVNSGKYKSIAIVAKSAKEARDVMVEGFSGLLSTTIAQKMFRNKEEKIEDPSIMKFKYYKSRDMIIWENGAKAYLIGGDNYEKIRGYQFDLVWMDEFAKYKHPEETWKQILFTLRIGDDPRCIITTTPKPHKILKKLTEAPFTHLTKGSTFQNAANLSKRFLKTIQEAFGGSWLGKQELEGELIMTKENTVWKREDIQYRDIEREQLQRVVIGIDPAVSNNENSDETGIIVAGLGYDDKMYILDDLSGKYNPQEWAKIACRAAHDYQASCIVAETNNGGDLVGQMINAVNPYAPFKTVRAIKNKVARAEPIALVYNNGKVFHKTEFCELEEQMLDLSYDDPPEKSPDRVDALVWATLELKNKEDQISCDLISIW